MASTLDNLNTAMALASAALAESYVNPKPSYSIDGESVSWQQYRSGLMSEINSLQKLIMMFTGPGEECVQGMT